MAEILSDNTAWSFIITETKIHQVILQTRPRHNVRKRVTNERSIQGIRAVLIPPQGRPWPCLLPSVIHRPLAAAAASGCRCGRKEPARNARLWMATLLRWVKDFDWKKVDKRYLGFEHDICWYHTQFTVPPDQRTSVAACSSVSEEDLNFHQRHSHGQPRTCPRTVWATEGAPPPPRHSHRTVMETSYFTRERSFQTVIAFFGNSVSQTSLNISVQYIITNPTIPFIAKMDL